MYLLIPTTLLLSILHHAVFVFGQTTASNNTDPLHVSGSTANDGGAAGVVDPVTVAGSAPDYSHKNLGWIAAIGK